MACKKEKVLNKTSSFIVYFAFYHKDVPFTEGNAFQDRVNVSCYSAILDAKPYVLVDS